MCFFLKWLKSCSFLLFIIFVMSCFNSSRSNTEYQLTSSLLITEPTLITTYLFLSKTSLLYSSRQDPGWNIYLLLPHPLHSAFRWNTFHHAGICFSVSSHFWDTAFNVSNYSNTLQLVLRASGGPSSVSVLLLLQRPVSPSPQSLHLDYSPNMLNIVLPLSQSPGAPQAVKHKPDWASSQCFTLGILPLH